MPYLSPLPQVMKLLYDAMDRGVTLEILVPEESNFVTNLNRKTLSLLMDHAAGKSPGPKLNIYFSRNLTHTKLIYTDRAISFGSANLTKKSFYQLGETNLLIPNDGSPMVDSIRDYIEKEKEQARLIPDSRSINYSSVSAFFEGILI